MVTKGMEKSRIFRCLQSPAQPVDFLETEQVSLESFIQLHATFPPPPQSVSLVQFVSY